MSYISTCSGLAFQGVLLLVGVSNGPVMWKDHLFLHHSSLSDWHAVILLIGHNVVSAVFWLPQS